MTWSDGRGLAFAAAAALALGACGAPEERGFALRAAAGSAAGVVFHDPAETTAVTVGLERREAVLTSVDGFTWRGRVPRGARLHVGVQLLPAAWRVVESLAVEVAVDARGRRQVAAAQRTAERAAPRWLDFEVDLRRYAGQEVVLEVSAAVAGLPPEHRHSAIVAWAPVTLLPPPAPTPAAERARPNILFLVVDTLRHDHLTSYGYARDTAPEIDRRLAREGVTLDEAYAQAPWTLPSAASYLTGRDPGTLAGNGVPGIPAGVATLAERLAALGYETGGFSGNPTVHAGNGFARGFSTFGATGDSLEAMFLGAEALNALALPWLRAHQYGGPFFLYLHYIDPHDPYENAETADNASRWEGEPYRGRFRGRFVHGLYTGRLALDSAADVDHLAALYDEEIRHVDARVGELLRALDRAVLGETLVVLTADHGEELHEHGGWKHGQSLYEEQIHVPLLLRWDGRFPPGRRLRGTVRLLDLVPTLVAAAGGEPAPEWDGVDLLPALRGAAPPPRHPAFAEHLTSGPLRAAAVLDRRKLVLFNRRTPFAPADEQQAHLWRLDRERFARVELYDLAADPGERRNLAAAGVPAALAEVIHRQLDRRLGGQRVVFAGAPAGARLRGRLVWERPPTGWSSYFLADDDRVALAGREVRFELGGEDLAKGFLLDGDVGGLESLEASLDGAPLPAAALRLGAGNAYAGGRVPAAALAAPEWPLGPAGAPDGARLHVWRPLAPRSTAAAPAPDAETLRRLRALGYIQ